MSQFFFSLPALHCWIGIHNVHMTLHDRSKLSQAFESTQIHTGSNLVQKKSFLWHDGIMQMLSRPKLQSFLRKHFQKPMPSSWEHLQKPWLFSSLLNRLTRCNLFQYVTHHSQDLTRFSEQHKQCGWNQYGIKKRSRVHGVLKMCWMC